MWRLPPIVSALLTVCAIAATSSQASAGDFTSAQILAALNRQRAAAGIPPVREEPKLAAGCAAYDEYVVRNGLQVADQQPVLGIDSRAYGLPLTFAYFFGRGVTHLRVKSQRLRIGGRSRVLVAAYAGGLSGNALFARASASDLSNPSAGFYSKIPAEAIRSDDHEEERSMREAIDERQKLTEQEEKAETEEELRSTREDEERLAAREAEEQAAELRIGFEHGDADETFHIKGP